MTFGIRILSVDGEFEYCRKLEEIGFNRDAARASALEQAERALRISSLSAGETKSLLTLCRQRGLGMMVPPSDAPTAGAVLLRGSRKKLVRLAEDLSRDPELESLARELLQVFSSLESPPAFLNGRNCRISLGRPLIMGVLNATPDSFFSGSRTWDCDAALRRGISLAADGADILDVGGESTRPGAEAVSEEEELKRVVPLIAALRREVAVPLSVDTYKSRVAREAVAAGADFINDIGGLRFDPGMAEVAASTGAGVFLMHSRGRPDRMQADTHYADLIGEILDFLREGISLAQSAGVSREKIAVDPGIGFGKSVEGNLEILRSLREFASLGCPVLIGTSRKGFIGKIIGQADPDQRLFGTLATVALGVAHGAHILRVHDVGPAREAALTAWAIRCGEIPRP